MQISRTITLNYHLVVDKRLRNLNEIYERRKELSEQLYQMRSDTFFYVRQFNAASRTVPGVD